VGFGRHSDQPIARKVASSQKPYPVHWSSLPLLSRRRFCAVLDRSLRCATEAAFGIKPPFEA
jgi:hypothetical protein